MDDRRRRELLRGERPIPALPRAIPASSGTQGGLRYEDATADPEPIARGATGGRKKVSPKNRARVKALSATEKATA